MRRRHRGGVGVSVRRGQPGGFGVGVRWGRLECLGLVGDADSWSVWGSV